MIASELRVGCANLLAPRWNLSGSHDVAGRVQEVPEEALGAAREDAVERLESIVEVSVEGVPHGVVAVQVVGEAVVEENPTRRFNYPRKIRLILKNATGVTSASSLAWWITRTVHIRRHSSSETLLLEVEEEVVVNPPQIVVETDPDLRYLSAPSVDRVLAARYRLDVVHDREVRFGDDLALGVPCPYAVGRARAVPSRSDGTRAHEAHFRCAVATPVP